VATAAGIIVVVGSLALVNEALSAPYQQGATDVLAHINWRLIPATAITAVAFAGIEHINAGFARALAYLALLTSLFVQTGSSPSVIQRLADAMGYGPPSSPFQPTKPPLL
jgi:hypothetical protein